MTKAGNTDAKQEDKENDRRIQRIRYVGGKYPKTLSIGCGDVPENVCCGICRKPVKRHLKATRIGGMTV